MCKPINGQFSVFTIKHLNDRHFETVKDSHKKLNYIFALNSIKYIPSFKSDPQMFPKMCSIETKQTNVHTYNRGDSPSVYMTSIVCFNLQEQVPEVSTERDWKHSVYGIFTVHCIFIVYCLFYR